MAETAGLPEGEDVSAPGAPGIELTLTDAERRVVEDVTSRLAGEVPASAPYELCREAPVIAHELPVRLRRALGRLRQDGPAAYALVHGLAVDDEAIGTTPPSWGEGPARDRTRRQEVQAVLIGSLLGEVFGWRSQQDGAVVHDVLPMREYENTQINFASQEPIWWHTEDAFHPFRPDYVGLLCLRNPTAAATTVSCAADWDLGDPAFDVLFEPRFRQLPDHSHGVTGDGAERRPVLFGPRERPYACVDPYFLEPPEDDRLAEVLRRFYDTVEASLRQVALAPGDLLLVDNRSAVHGRRPFAARYDGKDRWLKRISVSRDLGRCWSAWSKDTRHVLVGDR
ncbi:guanitoxin biosynthesis L-enduracididine beta-hydroxylase GntD [Streptomyces sp. NPDC050509]|uniref:guanitoxin biosynthesis L-enduracididine beta-hydroxylase GntD n=1 Tax=Streptomyces sp. NPDC050509 TaxID=3365620 RepID=UPI0037B3E0FD